MKEIETKTERQRDREMFMGIVVKISQTTFSAALTFPYGF